MRWPRRATTRPARPNCSASRAHSCTRGSRSTGSRGASTDDPLRAALALVVLLALAGATYQGVTTSLERRRLPHPGRLVSVGGHQLQIHCTGAGSPTVVLEAPAAGLSASWSRVQAGLTPLTRVCSYDRAGLGWSERGDGPFDPALVPSELRALLDGAREPAP